METTNLLFVCVLHMVSLCVATNSFPFQIMPPSSSTKKEAMEDRPTKLAKLSHLRKSVPYMSKSSLEQVLKFVKEEGVPELHSRKNMQEANQALTKQKTSSGPLLIDFDLVTLDGQTMPVQCTNLCTFLQLVYKQGGPWYQLLSKTMAQCQQKLHLVVYADEVTPGNALAPITARKVWAIYATIKEFHTHLQNADAWVTLCIVRSSTIANVDGHLSQLLKAILSHWFNTCFLHLQGLQLEEPQDISAAKAYTRVFLHLGFFIMDGAAHKFALSMKGDSGSRFCSLCKNVFLAKGSQDEDGQVATISSYTKHTDLQINQDVEIWDSWARMATRSTTVSAAQFKKWEQACGITFSPHAILADRSLQEVVRPTKIIFHDWMHALLCQGVMSLCMYNLLEALDCWATLEGWLSCWHVPHAFHNFKPAALFQQKRVDKHKKSSKFSCTASELLTLLPLLDHFLDAIKAEDTAHKAAAHCFQDLVHLVELFQATWHHLATPDALAKQVEKCLATWKDLGWPMIRKHHWLLHVASNFANHGILPNCFSMERKNKVVGQLAAAIQNTTAMERSIMEELLAKELSISKPFDMSIGLLEPTRAPKKLWPYGLAIWPHAASHAQDMWTSFSARIQHNATCSRGDAVLLQCTARPPFEAGIVVCFLSFQGEDVCIVHMFSLLSTGPKHCVWHDTEQQMAYPLNQVLAPVYWTQSTKGITTLTPFSAR